MQVCRFRYMSRRRQRVLFALLLAGVGAVLTVAARTLYRYLPPLQWLREMASEQSQYTLPFAVLVLLVFGALFTFAYGISVALSGYLSDRQGIMIFGPAYVELWRMAQCDVFAYADVVEVHREMRDYTLRPRGGSRSYTRWPVYTVRTQRRTYRMATSMVEYSERFAARRALNEPLSLEVALGQLESRAPQCKAPPDRRARR